LLFFFSFGNFSKLTFLYRFHHWILNWFEIELLDWVWV
jgi:hypothetical protein